MPEPLGHLMAAGALAGALGATTGLGSGLALPLLLVGGLSPATALAAVKLPLAVGDLAATVAFARRGRVTLRRDAATLASAFCAGACGAVLLASVASWFVLACLGALALVLAACSARRQSETARRVHTRVGATSLLALYIGASGIGAGSLLLTLGLAAESGQWTRALAYARALGAAANLGAVAGLLALGGLVSMPVLGLALAQGCGAVVGVRLAPLSARVTARCRVRLTSAARAVGR